MNANHHLGLSGKSRLKLIPLLSKEYRVVAIDMLGYGDSAPPPGEGDAIMALAQNVVHVLDALEIEKVHLYALHTGSVVAVEAAAAWPERIGTLILYALSVLDEADLQINRDNAKMITSKFQSSPDGSHLTALWVTAYGYALRYLMQTANRPSVDWHKEPESLTSPVFHPTPARGPEQFLTPEMIRFIDDWVVDALRCKETMKPVYASLYRDTKKPLPHIKAPTLHIEPGSPYEVYFNLRGGRAAELIPNCENIVLPGADDNVAEFNPKLLADAMLDWLRIHPL